MNAIIITVGDEILIGQVVDTNSAWIGQRLSECGIHVQKIVSLSDDAQEIITSLKQSVEDAEIIFMTGGLGPTKDDITKKSIAEFLGVEMFFHQPTFDRIVKIFERIGRPMSPLHHDQCLMPVGVQILRNSMGTAPGMLFIHNGTRIFSMPGVPYEMKAIMEEEILPQLKAESKIAIIHNTILTAGVGETTIENEISDIISDFPDCLKIAYLPAIGQVRLRLTAHSDDKEYIIKLVHEYTAKIVEKISDWVYGFGDSSLEKEILKLSKERNIKVCTAESCTGGNVAAQLVSVSGSSVYFQGGVVAYSNDIKEQVLHVSTETLSKYGAVSEETVKEMVDGALRVMKADIAVAISGIAGPDGGSLEKPVGTIWICVGDKYSKVSYLLKAGKDRTRNIESATFYALNQLRKFILSKEESSIDIKS